MFCHESADNPSYQDTVLEAKLHVLGKTFLWNVISHIFSKHCTEAIIVGSQPLIQPSMLAPWSFNSYSMSKWQPGRRVITCGLWLQFDGSPLWNVIKDVHSDMLVLPKPKKKKWKEGMTRRQSGGIEEISSEQGSKRSKKERQRSKRGKERETKKRQ